MKTITLFLGLVTWEIDCLEQF